jgi:hypothetical protein
MWIDIVSIVFVCVTMNHLGLVKAIQTVTKCNGLPIVGCPKCLTCWVTAAYGCYNIATYTDIISVLAISFLASYMAIWLELLEGFIDTLYLKLYDKIYENADDAAAADSDGDDSAGSVSEL